MATRKRKRLPKDIKEYIHDDNALKAVFEKCEINAYSGSKNILFFDISDEMVKWCLEQGADINYHDGLGDTPLIEHVSTPLGDEEFHEKRALLLMKYGADIHFKTGYPRRSVIFHAVRHGTLNIISALIDAGADPNEKNQDDETPLEAAFRGAIPAELIRLLPVAEFLFSKGVPVTDKLKEAFINDVKEIEFHRCPIPAENTWAIEFNQRVDDTVDKLYKLLDVEPVPKRQVHDGVSEIHPKAEGWMEQHEELWDFLVPGSGACSIVQGEVIRITGRLSHEVLDNGGANWDHEFRKMVNALKEYFKEGQGLSDSELLEVEEIAKTLPNQGKTEMYRLEELAVKWVLQNPIPIKLESVSYSR
ncbi:ankyrin repeat domain-containing protein [Butyrivibrio sp. FC2001]|uniref:ankyrin repeat domain-containing protein n=1 Tax=Butyrivibrio sp. FC2001 TaxID=1280671 RepID=UPI00041B2C7C|nr:ankyrin repeat domain-containing protein [Butyrivibrio sp. FC2001]